jgi:di/tricarboxylate transporter
MSLTADAWLALGVVALVIGLLAFTRARADLAMAAGLTLLLTLRILTPAQALAGFANEAVVLVAALFVVAAGLRETGAVVWLLRPVLGRPRSVFAAQLRLTVPVAVVSAFVPNTALTAMMLPVVAEWARRNQLPPSKLMMPLSCAAVLGGLCTLIGSNTNLVVYGLVAQALPTRPPIGLFDVAWVGLPCCVAGLIYVLAAGRRLLPERLPADDPPPEGRPVKDSTPPRRGRAVLALAIVLTMVAAAGAGWLSLLSAALLAAGAMVLTRCCSATAARRGVKWSVLVVIGCAFGIGKALEATGAAEAVARTLIGLAGRDAWLALALLYGVTMLFGEILSHVAAAAVVFPIALATANGLDVNFTPYAMAVMVAASCGFATPVVYPTNRMVWEPGGYHFTDYLRFGGPLNLVVWAVTVAVAPLVWPF